MVPHGVLDVSVICNCGISSPLIDSLVPHGGLDVSVICYCGFTSSLVFEIL